MLIMQFIVAFTILSSLTSFPIFRGTEESLQHDAPDILFHYGDSVFLQLYATFLWPSNIHLLCFMVHWLILNINLSWFLSILQKWKFTWFVLWHLLRILVTASFTDLLAVVQMNFILDSLKSLASYLCQSGSLSLNFLKFHPKL